MHIRNQKKQERMDDEMWCNRWLWLYIPNSHIRQTTNAWAFYKSNKYATLTLGMYRRKAQFGIGISFMWSPLVVTHTWIYGIRGIVGIYIYTCKRHIVLYMCKLFLIPCRYMKNDFTINWSIIPINVYLLFFFFFECSDAHIPMGTDTDTEVSSVDQFYFTTAIFN